MKFNARSIFYVALGGMIVFLSACAGSQVQRGDSSFGQVVPVDGAGSYTDLTPGELQELITSQDLFFVNVHVPYEGEIPGTDAFIPFDRVRSQLDEFPDDRDSMLVLYCRSGSMSATAARALVEEGYTNVYNLDGGFRAWEAQGYPFRR